MLIHEFSFFESFFHSTVLFSLHHFKEAPIDLINRQRWLQSEMVKRNQQIIDKSFSRNARVYHFFLPHSPSCLVIFRCVGSFFSLLTCRRHSGVILHVQSSFVRPGLVRREIELTTSRNQKIICSLTNYSRATQMTWSPP